MDVILQQSIFGLVYLFSYYLLANLINNLIIKLATKYFIKLTTNIL